MTAEQFKERLERIHDMERGAVTVKGLGEVQVSDDGIAYCKSLLFKSLQRRGNVIEFPTWRAQ